MNYKMLLLTLFVASSVQAMDPDVFGEGSSDSGRMSANPADVDQRIEDIIFGGGGVGQLQALCEQRKRMAPAAMPTRGRGRRKAAEDPLKAAREAAQRNLQRAEENLTWCGNIGRRNQVVAGALALLLGVCKGGYDLAQFWNEDADKANAGFGLATDGALALGGAYGIRLAIENGAAQTDHERALAMKLFVDTMAQMQVPTLQLQVGPAGSSSSSSLPEEYFTDDDASDGSSESASLADSSSHSGGASDATSRDVGSSSFLSTSDD